MKKFLTIFTILIIAYQATVLAGEADVIGVNVRKTGENTFRFSVTVQHKDTGWDHYANKWDVLDENGNLLVTRILHHPHVNEQPFTRSLSGVKIPSSVKKVTLRAHDSVHKYGGKTFTIELPW